MARLYYIWLDFSDFFFDLHARVVIGQCFCNVWIYFEGRKLVMLVPDSLLQNPPFSSFHERDPVQGARCLYDGLMRSKFMFMYHVFTTHWSYQ